MLEHGQEAAIEPQFRARGKSNTPRSDTSRVRSEERPARARGLDGLRRHRMPVLVGAASVLPLPRDYLVTNDGLTVFVTAAYMLFGAVLGAAFGFLWKTAGGRGLEAGRSSRASAALSVILLLLVNFVLFSPAAASIALAVACAIVVILSGVSGAWSKRLAVPANPWTIGFLLGGFRSGSVGRSPKVDRRGTWRPSPRAMRPQSRSRHSGRGRSFTAIP